MLERLINDYASTLTAAWASNVSPAAGTDIDVASLNDDFGNALPTTGQFRLRIDDEIVVVTRELAAAGKLRLLERGAETSVKAAHANGAVIEAVPTQGSMAPVVRISPKAGIWRVSVGGTVSTLALTINRLLYVPIYTAKEGVDTFRAEVTAFGTAGAVLRYGIYEDAGNWPGDLIADLGTVAATTPNGMKDLAITQTMRGGLSWLGIVSQVAVCTIRSYNTGVHGLGLAAPSATDIVSAWVALRHNGAVAGALPTPANPDIMDSAGPRLALRTV